MNCPRVRAQLGDYLEGDLELRTRTQVNEHLAGCASCAAELRELRSTVALLRALPDPTAPERLSEQVMARIQAGEDRTRRLPAVVRRVFDPRVAAPLAAGIAGLVWFGTLDGSGFGSPMETVGALSAEQVAIAKDREMWENTPQTLASRTQAQRRRERLAMPRLVGIERTARSRFFHPEVEVAGVGFFGRTDADLQNLDLDRQLDRALHNPMGFVRRVGAIEEAGRRSTVAPLAVLARRRGDAAAVAIRLRDTSDPLGIQLAAQFEPRGQLAAVRPPARRSEPTAGRPVSLPLVRASHTR